MKWLNFKNIYNEIALATEFGYQLKLEEAAARYYEENIDQSNIPREHYEWEIQELMVGFCAKYQAERMYSEEEVRIMLSESFKASQEGYNITSDEIIEQFKNKTT